MGGMMEGNMRSSSGDDDGLVMLDEDEDDDDDDDDDTSKEHGLTKFGGMIDSESDDEEDGDDEFMFNDEESDDSDALPIAPPGQVGRDALHKDMYSASDGYAFLMETQKANPSTLKSRNNRFYNHLHR